MNQFKKLKFSFIESDDFDRFFNVVFHVAHLFLILVFLGCSHSQKNESSFQDQKDLARVSFLKGQALTLTGDFDRALPFLQEAVALQNEDTPAALLLLSRCYDQLSLPEKTVGTLQQLFTAKLDPFSELRARSLLLKNESRLNLAIQNSEDLKNLRGLINSAGNDKILVLENLRWAIDFTCDQYCISEIIYLSEIQSEYLYIIQSDESAAERSAQMLLEKYLFFENFLQKDFLDLSFKKSLAKQLTAAVNKIVLPAEIELSSVPNGEVSVTQKLFFDLSQYKKRLVITYDALQSQN